MVAMYALKRGWSRAAIQTVAGGTPFVKSNGERGIALRKRFVQKLTRSFERLSVPQIRLVEFPIQPWRGITAFKVTYHSGRAQEGGNNRVEKNVAKSESARSNVVNIWNVSFRYYSHFCRILFTYLPSFVSFFNLGAQITAFSSHLFDLIQCSSPSVFILLYFRACLNISYLDLIILSLLLALIFSHIIVDACRNDRAGYHDLSHG